MYANPQEIEAMKSYCVANYNNGGDLMADSWTYAEAWQALKDLMALNAAGQIS